MISWIQTFLWLFLLVFPKGGIKIAGVPITWGYLLLGIVGICCLFRKKWTFHIPRYEILLCLFPFQIIAFISILYNGVSNVGMCIAFFVSFYCIPWSMLLLFSQDIESFPLDSLYKYVRRGVRFISLYGVVFFAVKHFLGTFFEIPFLTTNWDDFGSLEELKYINRGLVFKLISTYNNGNIFGICVLMLLPLYCYVEKKLGWRILAKLALILTFSRTVWFGLLFYEICQAIFFREKKLSGFLKISLSLSVLYTILAAFGYFYGLGFSFLLDPSLGNRIGQFYFPEIGFLSTEPFSGIQEIIYVGILRSFGVLGWMAFMAALVGIFLFSPRSGSGFLNPKNYKSYIYLGLLNYLFVACSDGAILYIPVMALFWFLVSFSAKQLAFSSAPVQ